VTGWGAAEPVGRGALPQGAGWLARSWVPIAFAVSFFLVWEGIVQGFSVPRYIIPAPSAIFYQFFRNLPRIWDYTLVTGGETLAGFALAILLGVPLALTVAFSSVLRKTFYPAAVTLEMVPKIAFAPLFVTWLGFGYLPKVIIVFLVCFFPILLNGILAFTSLPEDLGRFCRSTGAGVLRTFWNVRLPAALPQLFVGIKGAAVNATVGATIAEWIGGDAGLGYYIQIATGDLRMDLAFAIIIMLAALGLALFGAVVLVEKLLIPWHISQRAPVQGQR
jgi:NitT/TauT family transport system permease protein